MASSMHNMTTRNTRNRILQPQTYQDVAGWATTQWSCGVCTLKNPVEKLLCDACGSRRHKIPEVEAVLVVRKGDGARPPIPMKSKESSTRVLPTDPSHKLILHELENIFNHKPVNANLAKSRDNSQKSEIAPKLDTSKSDVKNGKNVVHFEKGFWSCESCTLLNSCDTEICTACKKLKASTTIVQKSAINRRKSNDPRGPVKFGVKETYDDIVSTCVALQEEFVDDSFPPGPKALFINGKTPVEKILVPNAWLRPSEISCKDVGPRNMKINWSVMCDTTDPSDIYQGSLGDCWLMGSLAMITERKELLDNIVRTKEINKAGAYIIRLNHFGRWKDIIVDNLLPCDQYQRLIYAKGKRKQLWVPLIEKAMAKLHGSYEALIGGSNAESLTTLTGFPCHTILLTSETLDVDLTWATLVSSAAAGFLIGTGTHGRNLVKMKENEDMGLKPKHAYSILKVNDECGPRLVKLRNPWGKESWSGAWSANSDLWTPSLKKTLELNSNEKGTFWMCFQDFIKHFEVLDICKIRQNWEFNSFQGIFVPFADTISHPCYAIQIDSPTELDITLFQSSWLRGRKNPQSIVPDVALVLLKSNSVRLGCTEEAKNWTLVKYTARVKERDVNLNLMVDPGLYYLIPVSFSHFTSDDKSDTYPEFEISIHSSRNICCNLIRPPNYLLADLIIKVGLDCCDVLKTSDSNVKLYHNLNHHAFGRGSLYIAENRHKNRSVVVEVNHELSYNVTGTRNLKTIDCVPPNSRQIINILTVTDNLLSYKLHFSLQTRVFSSGHNDNEINLKKMGYSGSHVPELNQNNYSLHGPRPI